MDSNKKCLAIFLDLAKAFDTVSVPILLERLEKIGIRESMRKRKKSREEIMQIQKLRERRKRAMIRNDPELYAAYKEKERQRYLKRKREESMRKRKKSREEIMQIRKLRQQQRRAMIRNDPELYAAYKEKERQRYLKRKREESMRKRKKSREEIMQIRKLRQRQRRAMIRNDPELYAAYKEKERQRYLKRKREEIKYKLINAENAGKSGKLVMVDGYTFYKPNKISRMWVCSKKTRGDCSAKIKIEGDVIIPCCLDHNHERPKYHITKDGQYIKI
ncbi:vicilin-like seed storage protein At2g18540 [Ostrinia furnacalis]|uniref:vicilin-like seed storage protein At2g18540 n=1 Tax=Ostrinia furnacalis TaxID=93504 RepID=UPI001038E1C8|nr:vicilin-like seed storage protein At2g18540 [Ostrinia furnacalis]